MKIKIDFLESIIEFTDNNIFSMQILNKKYFYRISSMFYEIGEGNKVEKIVAFNEKNDEIDINNKIRVYSDYFDFNLKKYINDIIKYLSENIEENDKESIIKEYLKLEKLVGKECTKLDIPIKIETETNISSVLKNMKLNLKQQNELLDNLFLLIEIEAVLNTKKILCFINLKQYLSKNEIKELYKYATYNSVKLIMIDSLEYKRIKEYEKVITIDEDLDEFVI